jgi:hypothetical protein
MTSASLADGLLAEQDGTVSGPRSLPLAGEAAEDLRVPPAVSELDCFRSRPS